MIIGVAPKPHICEHPAPSSDLDVYTVSVCDECERIWFVGYREWGGTRWRPFTNDPWTTPRNVIDYVEALRASGEIHA